MNKNKLLPAKPRLRFKEQDDLALLREVMSINPLQDPNLWVMVQEHILILSGKKFSIKTLRDHLILLIKQWLEKTKDLQDRSGIEESYSEKDQLCHQINEMMGENAKVKGFKKPKTEENPGRIIRDKFAEAAVENSTENDLMESNKENNDYLLDHGYVSVPELIIVDNAIQKNINNNKNLACISNPNEIEDNIRKTKIGEKRTLQRIRARTRRTNAQKQGLEYLENYDKTQNELKKIEQNQTQERINIEKEKLVIENRRLDLDERKFVLEEYERKKIIALLEEKMKDEKCERDLLLKVIERQENLLNALLKNK